MYKSCMYNICVVTIVNTQGLPHLVFSNNVHLAGASIVQSHNFSKEGRI